MSKYDDSKHENEPILCPREKCRRRNAPVESDEFSPRCWKCNTFLNVTPVERGDKVVVTVDDIHESGAGVGMTEDGYVVMVDGVLPECKARVKITRVKPNYSEGELVEKLEMDEVETEEEDDDDNPPLGRRDNHWGR